MPPLRSCFLRLLPLCFLSLLVYTNSAIKFAQGSLAGSKEFPKAN